MATATGVQEELKEEEIAIDDFIRGFNMLQPGTGKKISSGTSSIELNELLDGIALGGLSDDELKKIMSESNVVKVLLVGKTGTGKSTLVNGLIGKEVAREGEGVSMEGTTKTLSAYYGTIAGVEFVIFDSPGLQDGTMNDTGYLNEMKTKCKDVDLVMFAIRITDSKFVPGNPDSIAMENLTKAFGFSVWEKAVVLLTHADVVEAMNPRMKSMDDKKKVEFFKKLVSDFACIIRTKLVELKVPQQVVRQVKVIPTGHSSIKTLVDGTVWFSSFWYQTVAAIPSPSAKLAILKVNRERFKSEQDVKGDEFLQNLSAQPIIVSPIIVSDKSSDTKKISITLGSVLGGAIIGAACGTLGLLGGPIGLIGIPLGLYLGMAVGAIVSGVRKKND